MGDAGGIGPEIVVKAALATKVEESCEPVLIGDRKVLKEAAQLVGVDLTEITIDEPYSLKSYTKGEPSDEAGRGAFLYIKRAVEGCLRGEFHAMVTGPISKTSLRLAGYTWPGHTEMLAEFTGTKRYAMMLMGEYLRVILVTTHLPLRQVPDAINTDMVYEKIKLATTAAEMLHLEEPVIGVSALNPHAGEDGILGNEDTDVILPAVQKAQEEGIRVMGPVPADVIFYLARTGRVDIVVSMYHDQGLAPLKMIAFERGVNLTVGLPIIRTSPDHGTAYDIAWQGRAKADSIVQAIKIASEISPPKLQNQ